MIIISMIALLAGVGYYMLLTHYTRLWDKIELISNKITINHKVSILIPFRNEKENLPTLINSLELVDTGSIAVEYLFINDHSNDSGELLITEYAGVLNVKLLNNTSEHGKKAAMRLGWQHCTGDILLQTDADCEVPKEWLSSMLAPFGREGVLLAAGPVMFYEEDNFWKNLVNLDFMALIAIGAAHIQWGRPMICNAANLAYRKELVHTAELNDQVASGDDVFLLQSAYQKNKQSIRFVKDADAIVRTAGPNSFREFWNQRLRWSSKNGAYDIKKNTWLLAGVWMYNMLILLCLGTFTSIGATAAAYMVVLKVLAEDKFYGKFSSFFGSVSWVQNILLGQPFHILYMAVIPPLSQVLKYKWKERKVR